MGVDVSIATKKNIGMVEILVANRALKQRGGGLEGAAMV